MATLRELEPAGDMSRERFDRSRGLSRQQHVASQIEKPCHFVAAGDRLARTRLRRRRQIAGDHRDDEECEERDPVLRIGNRQRAERWQEEEVERQRCRNSGDRRDPESPERRGRQHDQQQHQGHRRRADLGQCLKHQGDHRNRENAPEQHSDVASGKRAGHRHADSLCHPARAADGRHSFLMDSLRFS